MPGLLNVYHCKFDTTIVLSPNYPHNKKWKQVVFLVPVHPHKCLTQEDKYENKPESIPGIWQ